MGLCLAVTVGCAQAGYEPAEIKAPARDAPTQSAQSTPKLPEIAMSAPTAIYLPSKNPKKEIKTVPIALKCGKDIPYPTSGPNVWKAFYCTDYALPGTKMPYYGIITGHSTAASSLDTVMNRLQSQAKTIKGKSIYVRTKTSKKRWLVFRFTGVYSVKKDRLATATDIWGGPNDSTAGRLVFLTCGKERYGQDPTVNLGFVSQFIGVR